MKETRLLQKHYCAQADITEYMVYSRFISKFTTHQLRYLQETVRFNGLQNKINTNQYRLVHDFLLSEEERHKMDLALQADYVTWNALEVHCAQLNELQCDTNPRPHHENKLKVKGIDRSLSTLKNIEEELRQSISIACVCLHGASDFNKSFCCEERIYTNKAHPKKRQFVDVNSVRICLIAELLKVHFFSIYGCKHCI